ncbi:MAG: inositol monophosphatase family protein, partial [Pseudomonadota bacterium]|nr:inositol monophosphatase family protein [Pseudomonadota bacterium]
DFGEVENLQVSLKGPADFVTNADYKAEKIIRQELSKARPDFAFLMEESGASGDNDAPGRWIVDPIDGTVNFMHGIPHFSISIALEQNGRITAGVVYDPIKDEMFWAERGKGAYINAKRLRVSSRRTFDSAVAVTGIPASGMPDQHELYLRQLGAAMTHFAEVRRFGSAALDLSYIAAGRFDAYWEIGPLKSWDIAAGMLILQEAGGYMGSLDNPNPPWHGGSIIAANAGLYADFRKMLKKQVAEPLAKL